MIIVTSKAIDKIKDILAEENNPKLKVRMFVQGGGCSGFQYGFTMDEEVNEDDFIIEAANNMIVTDAMSMQYLSGATVNYKEDLTGSQFVIDNPNAQSTCGCGSSFSI
jgi:iron-sulfur cluster insertion protein